MELSEEVNQSYLDFCNVLRDKSIKIKANYNPTEEQLTITENGTIYSYFRVGDLDKDPDEWDCTIIDNKYTFTVNREGEDTILEYEKSIQVSRDKENSDGTIAPGAYNCYEPIETITQYKVPESFKLENVLDPSIMNEIEKKKNQQEKDKLEVDTFLCIYFLPNLK